MGRLHICSNFLKSIGHHMENVGVDYLWTEEGRYPANNTQFIQNGKAYYHGW